VLETQTDYEAVVLLAAFRSVESAQAAEKALQAAGIEYKQRPLQPGRYQVADPRLAITPASSSARRSRAPLSARSSAS
jgi:hypothetical protein